MSQVLGGFGGYEVPGSMTYTNSLHAGIENGCITCHMADAYGAQAGGHTMNVAYESHGQTELLIAGCVDCHGDDIADVTHELQEEVEAMLTELHNILISMNIADSSGYLLGADGENRASSSNPAQLSADEAGCFFNFKLIEEDRSLGVHNHKYAKALLTNSIEALQ
jgi:formate-dependent nitrite reductase cytochrome c552 subunit